MFSGSYSPDDVIFLLKPVCMEYTQVSEKERLIQSGTRHYSEMLSRESLPSDEYMLLFKQALSRHQARFATDIIRLARRIAQLHTGPITLVSLARAGTPIGALINRVMRRLGRTAKHYSISLIRDRGIDTEALKFLLGNHDADSIVFIDGWTGKGVMARELGQAVGNLQTDPGKRLNPDLFVVADLSGTAAEAATGDDYLIPPSLLGAIVSGLISRSVVHSQVIGPGDFHGCVYQTEYSAHDLSNQFLDRITEEIDQQWSQAESLPLVMTNDERRLRREASLQLLADMATRFDVHDANLIKPGIGEATRVLLRRVPSLVLLRNREHEDVRHIITLADRRHVPVLIDHQLLYHAVALIHNAGKGES